MRAVEFSESYLDHNKWHSDSLKGFNGDEYISMIIEEFRISGKFNGNVLLDFYRDTDGPGYGVTYFRTVILGNEFVDLDFLERHFKALYHSYMEIAETMETETLPDDADIVTIYVARISKLLRIGAPEIIINNEKRFLINNMIGSSVWMKTLGGLEPK